MSRFSSCTLGVPFLLSVIVAAAAGLAGQAYAATTSTTTQRWQDFAPGKVVQVGATNYVKVADDQWLAMENPLCNDPVLLYPGSSKSFSYTGDAQSYTFYQNCQYRVELWGASGGTPSDVCHGGAGAYTRGDIALTNDASLHIYVGQMGNIVTEFTDVWPTFAPRTFNGGGEGSGGVHPTLGYLYIAGSGGGATDIRLSGGVWNNELSLNSRLMVAGGGGAGYNYNNNTFTSIGGAGGGISGYAGTSNRSGDTSGPGGNQTGVSTRGAVFGQGGSDGEGGATNIGAGGGGGYYGGGASWHVSAGGGGSSYISGHTGCVAVAEGSTSEPRIVKIAGCTTGTTDNACSIHYSGYTFTNTVMIDGSGYAWTNVKGVLQAMPNPTGGYYASGVGHTGNGAARITRLN